MDATDTKQLEKAKSLFESLLPGVIERLDGLGGTFLRIPTQPRIIRDAGAVKRVQVAVSYLVPNDSIRINMKVTCERQADGSWAIVHCSYHCGPSTATDCTDFRICMNQHQGFHFHLRGHEDYGDNGHIPAYKAEPKLSIDPLVFIGHVETYIATKKLPLKVK